MPSSPWKKLWKWHSIQRFLLRPLSNATELTFEGPDKQFRYSLIPCLLLPGSRVRRHQLLSSLVQLLLEVKQSWQTRLPMNLITQEVGLRGGMHLKAPLMPQVMRLKHLLEDCDEELERF